MFVDATGQSNRVVCQPHAMICACIVTVLVELSWTLNTGHTGAMLELDTGHWAVSLSLSLFSRTQPIPLKPPSAMACALSLCFSIPLPL